MAIPKRASQGRLNELFPENTESPPPDTFEIGLVLGGTVSAGAYTAGALDFLLQALEAWHDPADLPPHKVTVSTAGGASGGTVCGTILGMLSSRVVPHVDRDPEVLVANTDPTGNPLYDVWVNGFDILKLLSRDDLDDDQDVDAGTGVKPGPPPAGDGTPVQHVPSVMNCQVIDRIADQLIAFASQPGAVPRPYFAAPFRVAMTLANVRGLPFKISAVPTYNQFSGAAYRQHDDFAWFAFPNGTARNQNMREDEFWIDPNGNARGVVDYRTLADYATSSGSMPVAFVARKLSRPAEHYLYRPFVRPSNDPPGYKVEWIDPDWAELTDTQASGTYEFTAVDGGSFNNDPVTLIHRALAGLVGRNPQHSSEATRAMLMIDPLAGKPGEIPHSGRSLTRIAGSVVGMFIKATRYLTADIDLFCQEKVFSRYQLIPTRPEDGRVGDEALAGIGLGAIAGWCARAYRVHDYLLGRANMQTYLRTEFALTGDNRLFDGWSLQMRRDYAIDEENKRVAVDGATPRGSYFLPILPDRTGVVCKLPPWPVDEFDPDTLVGPIVDRLEAVLYGLRADNMPGVWRNLAAHIIVPGASHALAKLLADGLKAELKESGLLTH